MIPKAFTETIIRKTDIVALISEYVALTERGQNWFGLCPFDGGNKPNFTASADKRIWKCFKCGKGGDAIKFLMEIEKVTFPVAVEMLAKKLDLEVPYEE